MVGLDQLSDQGSTSLKVYIYISIYTRKAKKLRCIYIYLYIFTHILGVSTVVATFVVDHFNSGFLVIIGKSYEVYSHANSGKSKPSPSIGMQITLRWSAW